MLYYPCKRRNRRPLRSSTAQQGSETMNPKHDDKTKPAASGRAKPFFPPGSTGSPAMRLRAELQHEEAKLRIFKIFMALFVLCVGAFLVYSGISYRAESQDRAKRLSAAKETLAGLESGLADAALSPYARASLLVRIVNARTEMEISPEPSIASLAFLTRLRNTFQN